MSTYEGVTIIGAGLAGLGAARLLPGAKIFESQKHPGGHAFSHESLGCFWDEGAHICHSKNPEYLELVQTAARGVRNHVAIVKNYRNGEWTDYPVQNHLHQLAQEHRVQALKSILESLRQAHNSNNQKLQLDYDSWCVSQYGEYLTQHYYRPFTRKYWRTDTRDLSTDWLAGRLIPQNLAIIAEGCFGKPDSAQAVFATYLYPKRGGYFSFFRSLYEGLPIQYKSRVSRIEPRKKLLKLENGETHYFEHLISTMPLPELVRSILNPPPQILQAAESLQATRLTCVNMVIDGTDAKAVPDWFYIYDPEHHPARVSVTSRLDGTYAPLRLQAEVFRKPHEDDAPESLSEATVWQMQKILGLSVSRDSIQVSEFRVPLAYVISNHDRSKAVATILDWLSGYNIRSIGLYGRWEYVWSDQAMAQGAAVAHDILGA